MSNPPIELLRAKYTWTFDRSSTVDDCYVQIGAAAAQEQELKASAEREEGIVNI